MISTAWKGNSWVTPDFLSNYYYLTGDIDEDSARPIIEWILFHNTNKSERATNKFKTLYLFIDSGGGDSTTGFSICNFVKSSTIPVHTIGTGIVGSAALLIFMCGARRTLLKSTSILSHQFSWAIEGKYHDLTADHTELQNVQHRMLQTYKQATGLREKTIISELLPAGNRWLTSDEALTYNLCDEVVQTIDMSPLVSKPL